MQMRSHSIEAVKIACPPTFLAQQVRDRNFAILQRQFRHRRSAQAHLVQLLADCESRRSFIDEESRNACRAVRRIEVGKNNDHIRVDRIA